MQKCDTDIEIDIEIGKEIDIEKEIDKEKAPPTACAHILFDYQKKNGFSYIIRIAC